MPFLAGDLESDAAIFVGLLCRRQVQARDGDLFGPLRSETPQGVADNRVVLDFLLMLIAEDEDSCRENQIQISFRRSSVLALPRRIYVLIVVGFLLTPHALLCKAIAIHLRSDRVLAIVVLIEPAILILPAQPRIVITPSPQRIRGKSAIPAQTVVVEAERMRVNSVGTMAMEGTARRTVMKALIKSVREATTEVHAAGNVAAAHTTRWMPYKSSSANPAETCVSASSMTTVPLRPQRYCDHQGERRDRHQATHTTTL